MNKSLGSYRAIDLFIFTLIGCVLEGITTKMCGFVLNAAPTFTFALLIMFVATARWNLWGLICAPFLAGAAWLGGHFNDVIYFAYMYDWRNFIATTIALLTVGVNVIFYKKLGTKKTLSTVWSVLLLIALDYLLYNLFIIVAYRIITCGNPFSRGVINCEYTMYETINGVRVGKQVTKNVCEFVEAGIIYNLLGLAITAVGVFVLRSQGVCTNVVDKLVADRKEAELDRIDAETFTIEDVSDDSKASEDEKSSDTKIES